MSNLSSFAYYHQSVIRISFSPSQSDLIRLRLVYGYNCTTMEKFLASALLYCIAKCFMIYKIFKLSNMQCKNIITI
jgi:hypothetical protein